jgi:hypothetical protein
MQIHKERKKEENVDGTIFFLSWRHIQEEHEDFQLKRLACAAAFDIAAFKNW